MSAKKSPQQQPSGAVTIALDEARIRTIAYLLFEQKKSYNDYIWMLAEAELKLSKALVEPLKAGQAIVRIIPSKIIVAPAQVDINKRAESLAKEGIKIQDIHWFIAIRNFIIEEAKNQK
ncbi:MAG TPA: hypothetical protein VKM55_21095 [Candidatus Lokiarchaeia archaeon]|nr:hypothetical protein [Candidatus Lokiarchaeia archaeon]